MELIDFTAQQNYPIPSVSKSKNEKEFQSALKDGSALCYLLHHIDPDSIDKKNIRLNCSASRDQSIHNAQMFLSSCEDYYMQGC